LSQEQLKTYKVISFIDHSISRQQAAELLRLSTRQITRLKKGVLESCAESLIHKNTGRKPSRALSQEKRKKSLPSTLSQSSNRLTSFISKKSLLTDMILIYHIRLLLVYPKILGFKALKKRNRVNVHIAGLAGHILALLFK